MSASAGNPTITYIPRPDRTMLIVVENPGEEPFELTADVYTKEEIDSFSRRHNANEGDSKRRVPSR